MYNNKSMRAESIFRTRRTEFQFVKNSDEISVFTAEMFDANQTILVLQKLCDYL